MSSWTVSNPKDEADVVRKLAKSALWDVYYHEKELTVQHAKLGLVKALAVEAGYTPNESRIKQARDNYDDDETEPLENVPALIDHYLAQAASSVEYHERALREAHAGLGLMKAFLVRVEHVYPVDLEVLDKEVRDGDRH